MIKAISLIMLATLAQAQDVPYYQRAVDKDQDLGGIGQNFRDLSDRELNGLDSAMTSEDSLTPLSLTCGASNALIGSNHANGIFTGGTCTASAPALLESTQTFSAQTTFTGSVNISSPSALVVSGMATYTSSASFGGSAYSLAANYSSVIKGGWTIVASTNPAGATT